MLPVERQREIFSLITQRGSARVSELAETFSVTEETIRRDLEKLESEDKIKRSHGGAILREIRGEVSFETREIRCMDEKKAIAKRAVSFVEEGDSLFLDASTTAWQMASLLPKLPLTLITHSVRVINALPQHPELDIIMLGGRVQKRSGYTSGSQSIAGIKNFHVNKAFFSCQGVDKDFGLSDSNSDIAELKRLLLKQADSNYLLADSSKFGVRALAQVAPLDQVQHLVTDSGLSSDYRQLFNDLGVRVEIEELN